MHRPEPAQGSPWPVGTEECTAPLAHLQGAGDPRPSCRPTWRDVGRALATEPHQKEKVSEWDGDQQVTRKSRDPHDLQTLPA